MSDSPESLADVGGVVRRTLAARTRDHHLVEDLTQETLVRVAAAEHRLSPDEQRAYAVVTARNLLTSHARGQSVRRRHIHRLVEYTGLDGPEELTLEREETDALAAALDHIDAGDRDLLLRHEVDGVDLATLAHETDMSSGAIAMRLARTRASLRLEFLLAFRRVELPTDRCRPVLLALSAGDRRRQVKLDAAGHLEMCAACASLAQPITERNRRIAGWLPIPAAAEGVRRAWRKVRSRPIQAAAGAGVVAAAAATLLVAPWSEDASTTPAATGAPPPATAAAAAPPAATAGTASAPPAASPCRSAAPLDELDPARALGCPFAATTVTVTDVPTDEGFWATVTNRQPVWIHLVGRGESPIDIEVGQRLRVAGVVRTPPADPTRMGLPATGDPRAASPDFYLEVEFGDVRPAG